jgi:hypothetical protein
MPFTPNKKSQRERYDWFLVRLMSALYVERTLEKFDRLDRNTMRRDPRSQWDWETNIMPFGRRKWGVPANCRRHSEIFLVISLEIRGRRQESACQEEKISSRMRGEEKRAPMQNVTFEVEAAKGAAEWGERDSNNFEVEKTIGDAARIFQLDEPMSRESYGAWQARRKILGRRDR